MLFSVLSIFAGKFLTLGLSASEGMLYFFKFPLLALICCFVFLSVKTIIKGIPNPRQFKDGRTGESEIPDGAPVMQSGSLAAKNAARSSSREQTIFLKTSPQNSGVPDITAGKNESGLSAAELLGRQTMIRGADDPQPPSAARSFNLTEIPTSVGMAAVEGGCLELISGSGCQEKIIPLDKTVIFGRSKGCTVWLNDMFISGRHARVSPGPHGPVLEDLDSRNGTFFDNRRIEGPVILRNGDVFSLGDCVFRYKEG